MDTEIYQIICSNIRVSEQRIGDVQAQASALLVGADRLAGLLDRYGDATVVEAIAAMRRLAAAQMRANIALIPEGSYAARAIVDSDGVVNEPLIIALTVTRTGDGLHFDFAGSSPPCMGPMNSVRATTLSSVYLAMRHIFPDVPISAGPFEPLTITGIEGIPAEGARFALPVANYAIELDADGGGRVLVSNPGAAGRVAVRFTAGLAADWTSLPEALRHGVLRLAAFQYRSREDDGAASMPPAAVAALWRPWRRLRLA